MSKAKKTLIIGGIPLVLILFVFVLWNPLLSRAFEIRDVNVEIKNNFVLSPAKLEVFLDPGGSVTKNLAITNRTANVRDFKIDIEDFIGSHNPNKTTILLGDEKGPYSLKNYIKPEISEFTLEPKQQIILPITIAVPEDGEPGGLYGAILVSSASISKAGFGDGASSGVTTVSRLGSLFFVRVKGDAVEDGFLESFNVLGSKKIFYEGSPTGFELLFRNNGNVHLNPYGVIKISNVAGIVIDEIEVEPYFAMPDSLRYRKMEWDKKLLAGRYRATAYINRGYGDIVDELSVTFWVIPWKILVVGFSVIVLFVIALKWFASRFEFRRK